MALDLATVRSRVAALIGQSNVHLTNGSTTNARIDEAALQAVERYSQDRPRRLTTAAAAVGAATYNLALPTGWVEGFSEVENIEYPVPTTRAFPVYLPRNQWGIVTGTDGASVIRSFVAEFSPSSNYSIVFTAPRAVKDLDGAAASTVPAGDESAFVKLTAAKALLILAASTASETDSSIGVDVAGHREKADRYRSLAKDFAADYEKSMAEDGGPPPVAFVDTRNLLRRSGIFRKVIADDENQPSLDAYVPFGSGTSQ